MAEELVYGKDARISDVLRDCPHAGDVFNRHRMGCLVCLAASSETIEQGASMHGLDAQTIVDELNAACADRGMEKPG